MPPWFSLVPATPSQISIASSGSTPVPECSPFYGNQLHAAMAEEARKKRSTPSSPVEPVSKRLRSCKAAQAAALAESKGIVDQALLMRLVQQGKGEMTSLQSSFDALREQRDKALSELEAAHVAVSKLRSSVTSALNALQSLQAYLAELDEL
ncbi:hypothetical protein H0H92_010359 [Tricholoma furcatifolium]|nr:hypothetical protein H0H92_010359 [Tricholoma furcatifolium]